VRHSVSTDKSNRGNYPFLMNIIRRTLDIDADTDAAARNG
jgi:hypothetical protein